MDVAIERPHVAADSAPATQVASSGKPEIPAQQPTVRIADIVTGRNPRKYFDPAAMAELEEGVKAVGVITPVLVRRLGADKYELIAGERRCRAASAVFGDDYLIPAYIIEADDSVADAMAQIENTHRQNMSPAEEAEAAAKLLGDLGGDRAETARRLGLKPDVLAARLALMNATPAVRDALSFRKIALGHAELLASLPKAKQDAVLENLLSRTPMPGVDACKAMLQSVAKALASAIFDKAQCATCNHNSEVQGTMFAEAIDSGYCTNGGCYDEKTDAQLLSIKASLVDEFPLSEIMRPGDNYRVIKLVAEGTKGVGADQAQACKACAKYGAAVMGTPDAMGTVIRGACFDPLCNSKMVAKRIKSDTEAAAANKPAASSSSSKAKPSEGAKKASAAGAKAAITEIRVTGQTEEYRKALWRDALRAELRANGDMALKVLVAAAMNGNATNISTHSLNEAMSTIVNTEAVENDKDRRSLTRYDMDIVLTLVDEVSKDQRKAMICEVTAQMVERMADKVVVQTLKHYQVDLRRHYRLDDNLLKRLTKSEIEVLCKDIGLDAAMGDSFKKAMAGKKDEMVKALLGVADYDYSAALPSFLSLDVKL